MRARQAVWVGLAAAAVLSPRSVAAQTIEERIKVIEEKIEERGAGLAAAAGIDINALVAVDYQYSFNRPESKNVPLHVFDTRHNSFILEQASLFFSRFRDDEPVGFAITLDFGKEAELIAADWDGDGSLSSSEESNSFEVREAYLTYESPLLLPTTGQPITFKAGKFVTLLGYEVIDTYQNVNPNISHSIAFGFGIPYTHTGLLSSLPAAEWLVVDLGVVNGWDNAQDGNDGKTLLAGVGLTPADPVSVYLSGTYGAEQPDRGGSKRGVLTANATWKVTEEFALVLDGVWGNENDIYLPASGEMGTADWYGGVGYAIVDLTEALQVVLRGEMFDDPDGVRTTSASQPLGAGTVWAITPTLAYQLTEHLLGRVEYRYDRASRPYFDFGNTPDVRRTSNTVLAQALYAF